MSDILVKTVESEKELEQFIKLPWAIYRNDPCWVPPLIAEQRKMLDTGKNAFFEHARAAYFLAQRNGKYIGRITAHIDDNSNEFHKEKCGFFGFFECIDDQNAAQALFTAAGKWLKEQGMDTIRGPFNFTTNDTAGLLIDAFDSPPVIEMTYNPAILFKTYRGMRPVQGHGFLCLFLRRGEDGRPAGKAAGGEGGAEGDHLPEHR